MGQITEYLYCLAIFATVAAECLVIAWSATSQRTRLARGLIAWAAIALLIPARAYVPALMFTMTAVLAWALAGAIWRWQPATGDNAKPFGPMWRFQLGDVFVLILVIATVAALLRQFPGIRWPAAVVLLPLVGLPLAPILVFAHYAVVGRSRVRMAIATLAAIFAAAGFLVWSDAIQQLQLSMLIRFEANYLGQKRHEVMLSALLVGCLAACIALVVGLSIKIWKRPPERWKRVIYAIALAITVSLGILASTRYLDELLLRRATDIGVDLLCVAAHAVPLMCLALLVAVQAWLMNSDGHQASRSLRLGRGFALAAAAGAIVPGAWLYWQMVRPLPFPAPPSSPTNNYERIIAICRRLASQRGISASPEILIHPLVEEASWLLEAPNFVPTNVLEEEAQGVYRRRVSGGELLALTRFLNAAAEREYGWTDHDRGTEYCLAAIRFGEMFHRGGTTGHVTALFQQRAVELLAENRGRVSASKAHEVVQVIEHALATRDDFKTLQQRERISWERRMGWSGRLKYRLDELLGNESQAVYPVDDYLPARASLRALQTLFAIRLFEEEHRRLPKNFAELVPDYLPSVPIDPYSRQPLIYRSAFDDYELYSVGRDRTDNGGKFDVRGDYGPAGLDLDLSWKKGR